MATKQLEKYIESTNIARELDEDTLKRLVMMLCVDLMLIFNLDLNGKEM